MDSDLGLNMNQPFPTFREWYERWIVERCTYPDRLKISVNDPLQPGDKIIAEVFPQIAIRDLNQCYEHPKYKDIYYEIPRYLIREHLTENTIEKLNSAFLSLKKQIQCDTSQAFASILQYYLVYEDFSRALDQRPSILAGPCYGDLLPELRGPNLRQQVKSRNLPRSFYAKYKNFVEHPLWNLNSLLHFWKSHGNHLTHDLVTQINHQNETPDPMTIPITWKQRDVPPKPTRQLVGSQNEVEPTDNKSSSVLMSSSASDDLPCVFKKLGHYWTLTYENQTVHIKDLKGLHYMALLLEKPLVHFDVMKMVALVEGHPNTISSVYRDLSPKILNSIEEGGFGDAGPILDDRAVKAYRDRLKKLDVDLDQAQKIKNVDQENKIQGEIDFIAKELKKATGLGGRIRPADKSFDRPRKAVGNAIKNSIAQIKNVHPQLALHLHQSLTLGKVCHYQPPQPISWSM